jgi:hypothetical protein
MIVEPTALLNLKFESWNLNLGLSEVFLNDAPFQNPWGSSAGKKQTYLTS